MVRFGIFLKKLRAGIPLTLEKAAEKTSLSVPGIGRIERKAIEPSDLQDTSLTLFARAYLGPNAGADDLVQRWKANGKAPKNTGRTVPKGYKGIPVMGSISASGMVEFLDNRHHEADEYLPAPSIYSPDSFALRIHGSSMSPKYEPGDLIICEPISCDDVMPGDDCYVQLDGNGNGENCFKRVYASPRGNTWLLLMPLNPAQAPFEVECAKIIRLARAVAIHRPIRRG